MGRTAWWRIEVGGEIHCGLRSALAYNGCMPIIGRLDFIIILLLAQGLDARTGKSVPYYESAKPGEIRVHEEGEVGTFPRKGLIPVGDAAETLKEPTATTARAWLAMVCEAMKTPKAIHFPTGDWKDGAPKDCVRDGVGAQWIDRGEFKNTGLLKAAWPADGKQGKPGRNVLGLIATDEAQQPRRILKILGGLNGAGDISGEAVPEFVTDDEIVVKFEGCVSEWQIVLKHAPGGRAVTVEELL